MRESPAGPSTARSNRDAKDPHPWQASWGDLFSSNEDNDDQEASQMSQNQSSSHSPTSTSRLDSQDSTGASTSAPAAPQVAASRPTAAGSSYIREETDYSKWTVLREGDGGRHVHELQVALTENGFWPGDDDMTWWQFGDATCSAVQTFQVVHSLQQLSS